MRKALLVIVFFLVLVLVGTYMHYTSYQCTNDSSYAWKYHIIDECSVHYVGDTVSTQNENEKLERVHGAHIPTFKELNQSYAADRRAVYYHGTRVEYADPNEFTYVGGEYYRDNREVFWRGALLEEANSSDFVLFPGYDSRFGKDNTHEYFNGKKIIAASTTVNKQFLISPFNGEEVTRSDVKEIFWRPAVTPEAQQVFLAVVGNDNSFNWLFDATQEQGGSYLWNPLTIRPKSDVEYRLVFYVLVKGEMYRVEPPAKFRVVELGSPRVNVLVNYSDNAIVRVKPDESTYVSWASSNVEKCYRGENVEQPKTGHMVATFPTVAESKVTDHVFEIYCTSSDGTIVEDSVTIRSSFLDFPAE